MESFEYNEIEYLQPARLGEDNSAFKEGLLPLAAEGNRALRNKVKAFIAALIALLLAGTTLSSSPTVKLTKFDVRSDALLYEVICSDFEKDELFAILIKDNDIVFLVSLLPGHNAGSFDGLTPETNYAFEVRVNENEKLFFIKSFTTKK